MIEIAICDDEEYMIKNLYTKVNGFFRQRNFPVTITCFSDGKSLLRCSREFQIIFLDIQMKDMSGMDTARVLRKRNYDGHLIFVTVLNECVYDAFEVQAFDYLVKPLEDSRFNRSMERLLSSLQTPSSTRLLIQRGNECRIISFHQIIYCEVINRKIYIHMYNNEIIDYYDKIEQLETKLDQRFFRCHRSYLVNLKYIQRYDKNILFLTTGEQIPVSRLRTQELSGAILQYMKEWGRYPWSKP